MAEAKNIRLVGEQDIEMITRAKQFIKINFDVDRKFDHLMLCDIKVKIAEAFIDLESNIRPVSNIDGTDFKELVEKKTEQMKKELNTFIDSQAERIVNTLKHS